VRPHLGEIVSLGKKYWIGGGCSGDGRIGKGKGLSLLKKRLNFWGLGGGDGDFTYFHRRKNHAKGRGG